MSLRDAVTPAQGPQRGREAWAERTYRIVTSRRYTFEVDERGRRLALNEALFRDVNERIHDATRQYPGLRINGEQDYVCECSNPDCTFHLRLEESQYERVRASGRTFVVAPDHYLPEIEDVVEKTGDYWIVAKREETGEFVALLDPRRTTES